VACKKDFEPLRVQIGIPQTKIEESISDANDRTKSGRVITAFYSDFTLVSCYLPCWGGSELKHKNYKLDFEKALHKYLSSLDSALPIILCGDLNNPPDKSSYFKDTILPIRDFIDSYKHVVPVTPTPSPAKKQKKAKKSKGNPGSTYYAKDNSRSSLPIVDPLDRSDINGVRFEDTQLIFSVDHFFLDPRLEPHLSSSIIDREMYNPGSERNKCGLEPTKEERLEWKAMSDHVPIILKLSV
jgi:exonuclease III